MVPSPLGFICYFKFTYIMSGENMNMIFLARTNVVFLADIFKVTTNLSGDWKQASYPCQSDSYEIKAGDHTRIRKLLASKNLTRVWINLKYKYDTGFTWLDSTQFGKLMVFPSINTEKVG